MPPPAAPHKADEANVVKGLTANESPVNAPNTKFPTPFKMFPSLKLRKAACVR